VSKYIRLISISLDAVLPRTVDNPDVSLSPHSVVAPPLTTKSSVTPLPPVSPPLQDRDPLLPLSESDLLSQLVFPPHVLTFTENGDVLVGIRGSWFVLQKLRDWIEGGTHTCCFGEDRSCIIRNPLTKGTRKNITTK